jgi:hypothetical protein
MDHTTPAWGLSRLRPGHPSGHPSLRHAVKLIGGDNGARSEHCACNLHHGGHNDKKWHSLSPEEPGPKAFRDNMGHACFPKHF